tara:strand:- start:90 stop:296 length:207 start_codon:yes stop_codon:yes gene_type:complete
VSKRKFFKKNFFRFSSAAKEKNIKIMLYSIVNNKCPYCQRRNLVTSINDFKKAFFFRQSYKITQPFIK